MAEACSHQTNKWKDQPHPTRPGWIKTFVLRIESDALICPDGHGRVLGVANATDYANEKWKHDSEAWRAGFPQATKQERGWKIVGKDGLWKRQSPEDRETSRLDLGEQAPDGMVGAKVDLDVFAFVPLKSKVREAAHA